MRYTVTITIALKDGMLDPEAEAIRHALANLGFGIETLTTARVFRLAFDAPDRAAAKEQAGRMCERLLANPVIHRFEIEVRE